jgi:hypothetical protein
MIAIILIRRFRRKKISNHVVEKQTTCVTRWKKDDKECTKRYMDHLLILSSLDT